ncbi:hypothetical protein M0805_001504 [Coniferiporia weirii]|nr:hypothetical protein M0805_001504 [Coniferiporia weirii]
MSKEYKGASRRLVIAFDVGTTFSGVSYCLLDPDQEPKICNITRYPGQEHASGSSKIPSFLYYDRQGLLCAAGAEALLAENVEKAEDEEWTKVEWFKLRMRPDSMPVTQASALQPLPARKTLVRVFADFLGYLMNCAEKFIRETHLTLSRSWDTLKDDITFILGHPNGWQGTQQNMMRKAAVMAKMIPDTPQGRSRVKFVTEGEASLHYCLREGSMDNDEKGFVIADLGGGTLDFSAYKVIGTQPLGVGEISAAKCELQGSTFVTARAKSFIRDKLKDSRYGSDEHVKQISERFDETTKKFFRDTKDVCLVSFGSLAEKDPENGIRSGKLRLSGEDVASFFKPSISASVAAIIDMIEESSVDITTVYLVGGFSASPYLTAQLKLHLSRFDISVTCPDGQTAKAVADGAISFYLDQFVSSRMAAIAYGMKMSVSYDPDDTEHVRRKAGIYLWPSGAKTISGSFSTVLRKGTLVSKETEFKLPFNIESTSLDRFGSKSVDLLAFRGSGEPPAWTDEAPLDTLCTVTADTSGLMGLLRPLSGTNGQTYWTHNYELILQFGGTELKAQISWEENGVEKRGTAHIVYDEEFGEDEGREDEEDEENEKCDGPEDSEEEEAEGDGKVGSEDEFGEDQSLPPILAIGCTAPARKNTDDKVSLTDLMPLCACLFSVGADFAADPFFGAAVGQATMAVATDLPFIVTHEMLHI